MASALTSIPFHPSISLVPLLVALAYAALVDWRTRRIPNGLVLLTLVGGVIHAILIGVPAGPSAAVAGMVLGFGLLLVPYALGAMGGGDVKLLAAIGVWLGPTGTFVTFAVAAIAGLGIVVTQCAMTGRLRTLGVNSLVLLTHAAHVRQVGTRPFAEAGVAMGRGGALRSIDEPLPYAVPLLIGVFVAAYTSQVWSDGWRGLFGL